MTVDDLTISLWVLGALLVAFFIAVVAIWAALIEISESLRKLTRHIPESEPTKETK